MTTEPSTHVGPYRVIAKLGEGGMAHVLLALKPGPAGFRKLLVIKQLRKELLEEPEYLSMFLDEARLAARLAHSNVVRTFEVGEHEGGMFIAMDYLEGQPLNRVIRRKPKLPLACHIHVLSEVLSGLHYAHNLQDFDGTPLNVIHRDVSPHNVFVTYNGEVQLLDFGIAKAVGASSQTKTGTFKGKVSYIAPEQALANDPDRRADIFSVGIMLWEAVSRRRLWKSGQDLARLNARIKGAEPRLREVAPDADPLLLDICDKAMALDPDDRYATADEFRKALKPYLREHPATSQEIGAFVSEKFAVERAELRDKIEHQLKVHEEATNSAEIPIVDVGLGAHTPLTGEVPGQSDEGNRRWLRPFIAVAAIGAVVGGVVLFGGSPSGTDAPQEPPTSEAAPATIVAPTPEPAEPPPAEGTVNVRIVAEPTTAVLYLDGTRLAGNPFHADLEPSGELHRLRVSAEGYTDHEEVVAFDRDREMNIVLDAEAAPRGMWRGGMRATMARAEPTAAIEPTEPVVAPTPPPAMVTMEDPATPRGPRPRQIDETNPY